MNLEAPEGRELRWLVGEKLAWTAGPCPDQDWAGHVESYLAGKLTWIPYQSDMFVCGPEELVRPLLAAWRPDVNYEFAHRLKRIVARFELDAHDAALHVAKKNPFGSGPALMPFLSTDVARAMADWRFRLKSARELTAAWFARHGLDTVPYLVPDALGKRKALRDRAHGALWLVAAEHGLDAVVAAARTAYGDEAASGVAALTEPAGPPPKPVRLPRWAAPDMLPAPAREDGTPLDADRFRDLLLALAGDRPADTAGLTRASLAAFALALFEAWLAAGTPSREKWAMRTLGRYGDDAAARRLAPLVREWPKQSGHERAALGARVLAEIGTDLALAHLYGIAGKTPYPALRDRAWLRLEEVAAARGMALTELLDRLVPDFGLDTVVLDYGPRSFTVGLDAALRLQVLQDGKPRKGLPKPGLKDDAALAEAARRRLADLRKDVRGVVSDQLARLEWAMTSGRTWAPADFRAHVAGHAIVGRIASRLVWHDLGGRAFRIAEDGTFADVHDDPYELSAGGPIGLAHPVELDVAAWARVFVDYEILQPFAQLSRPVHRLTDAERGASRLDRFAGAKVATGRLLGLTRRDWQRGVPQDGGVEHELTLPLDDGSEVVIDLDPGIAVGLVDLFPDNTLTAVRISRGTFGDLGPITASEILADLTALTS
ncbi:DUF4132 domain-containing protein [Actinomadura parmotrematis]|uniref:DUF4132 domain-containing protein n=1 Tax=Actinomadura parmotrematis TaxID=2864039 RepID=A0ABS7FZ02_9ACTN|nr:DUF4132 domain-containing protein [Actinomadura parmotrematis]MBW8485675.1 DUF4132 domain-containing protein [Actinomadura parmotrematis]